MVNKKLEQSIRSTLVLYEPMVEFVGHTLLLGSVSFNVNNIPNFVCREVG